MCIYIYMCMYVYIYIHIYIYIYIYIWTSHKAPITDGNYPPENVIDSGTPASEDPRQGRS